VEMTVCGSIVTDYNLAGQQRVGKRERERERKIDEADESTVLSPSASVSRGKKKGEREKWNKK